jgi:hypothetical protein
LLTWEKHAIEFSHAEKYVDDIKIECLKLGKSQFTFN